MRFAAIQPTFNAKNHRANLDRLTLAEYSIDASNEAFTIDDLGNRDSVIVRDGNNVNYDIDNLSNRYDSVGGNTLAYDAAGNLTADKDGYQYEYDYENRIAKITKDSNDIAEFSYDALGRRIKKRDSIADTNNIYYYNDNWQILCDYNDAGTPQSWFAYGNYIDEVVLMSKSFTSWLSVRYYIHDHLYSPAALMGATGASPIERYEYDAYGNCYILEPNFAPDPDGKTDYGNPYYFTGRQLDFLDGGDLKIQYNRNRYYDYYTGRFTTHDPLAVKLKLALGSVDLASMLSMFSIDTDQSPGFSLGPNLYEYAGSDPATVVDPHGLWGWYVHYYRTEKWAQEVGLCFKSEIAGWCERPDLDYRRPGAWAVIPVVVRTITSLPTSLPALIGLAYSEAHLRIIARWHFPGADLGHAVEPGGTYAKRQVEKGLKKCNLHTFSEGLHQLQDSYSHQSGGRQPPVYGKVGHSRDRYGWYWEAWDNEMANEIGGWYADDLGIDYSDLPRWFKKLTREVTVVIGDDTDVPHLFYGDFLNTQDETKEQMQNFWDRCRCIKEGPHQGECSRCRYYKKAR